jgi:hypothetical protein
MAQVEAESAIRLMEWLTFAALLIGPIAAIQIDRLIERYKERRRHKLNVFHTLMATRGARLSPTHVEALNRIDFEFYGDRPIQEAWRLYLDHLSVPSDTVADQNRWFDTGFQLFTELLTKMATSLKYQFDPLVLKKGGYYPKGHGDIEADQTLIRKAALNVLEGKQPLKVNVAAQVSASQVEVLTPTPVPLKAISTNGH